KLFARSNILEPQHELERFILISEPQECIQCHRCVSKPRIPIVPVPDAANFLRQTERWSCHNCTCRFVGKQLQKERRTNHHFAPATAIRAFRDPCPPELNCVVHESLYSAQRP